MEKFGRRVVAASWDSVIFDVPDRPALQRVPLLDPLRGTREQVGQMIDDCDTVDRPVRRPRPLTRRRPEPRRRRVTTCVRRP